MKRRFRQLASVYTLTQLIFSVSIFFSSSFYGYKKAQCTKSWVRIGDVATCLASHFTWRRCAVNLFSGRGETKYSWDLPALGFSLRVTCSQCGWTCSLGLFLHPLPQQLWAPRLKMISGEIPVSLQRSFLIWLEDSWGEQNNFQAE